MPCESYPEQFSSPQSIMGRWFAKIKPSDAGRRPHPNRPETSACNRPGRPGGFHQPIGFHPYVNSCPRGRKRTIGISIVHSKLKLLPN